MSFIKSISFVTVLIGILCLPLVGLAQTVTATESTSLKIGSSGTSVRDLQTILKTDPTVYPQGLVTGYYGLATQQAIKNLQAKYGLPQTGVVDEATIKVIFPSEVQLNVISPNGSENWDKSTGHSILWKVTVGPVIANGQEVSPSVESKPEMVVKPPRAPFFSRASIDLVRDSDSSFLYHISTVDVYQTQYQWKIPTRIANGSDYRIKISVGGEVPCLYRKENTSTTPIVCPMMYPQYSASDVSDNTFSIAGTVVSDDAVEKLRVLLEQLQQIINSMRQVLNNL